MRAMVTVRAVGTVGRRDPNGLARRFITRFEAEIPQLMLKSKVGEAINVPLYNERP